MVSLGNWSCMLMIKAEWESSNCAKSMLSMLHQTRPGFFRSQVRPLHRFLIACCWKHQHFIPQEGLRNGLRGAEKWITGEIDDAELDRLNYYAEADAFFIDYAKTPAQISDLKSLMNGIEEVRVMPFKKARELLLNAAYFAEGSMIYPTISPGPWNDSLFTSDFLCPDLLREFLKPGL